VGPRTGAVVAGVAGLVTLTFTACGGLAPAPTPTPAPTATSVPAPPATALSPQQAQPQAPFDPSTASPTDVENAFLSNVDDLIAEVTDLAVTPCPDMTVVTRQNPNLVPSIRGFAAAVKRISAAQAVLNTDAVKSELSDLDNSMSQLEGALSQCGIK
jgi:hypothetical protein